MHMQRKTTVKKLQNQKKKIEEEDEVVKDYGDDEVESQSCRCDQFTITKTSIKSD